MMKKMNQWKKIFDGMEGTNEEGDDDEPKVC
jgi:hypothetical protein